MVSRDSSDDLQRLRQSLKGGGKRLHEIELRMENPEAAVQK